MYFYRTSQITGKYQLFNLGQVVLQSIFTFLKICNLERVYHQITEKTPVDMSLKQPLEWYVNCGLNHNYFLTLTMILIPEPNQETVFTKPYYKRTLHCDVCCNVIFCTWEMLIWILSQVMDKKPILSLDMRYLLPSI